MVNTEDLKDKIFELHHRGVCGKHIANTLGLKNHQPIYNFFRKYDLKNNPVAPKRIYTLDENYFKVINTEEKAYILGFICADGYVAKDRLVISISKKDIDLLEHLKKEFRSNQSIKHNLKTNPYTKEKTCNMVTLQISSRAFVKPLIKMDLDKNKTYTLNSKVLNFVPKYLIKDFLRGYFDGDGNVMYGVKYGRSFKYNINICGNKEFLLNTYQKYFPSVNKLYYEKKSKQMHVWKISSKKKTEEFLHYIYCNSKIHLKRKYKIYLKSKRAHVKPI